MSLFVAYIVLVKRGYFWCIMGALQNSSAHITLRSTTVIRRANMNETLTDLTPYWMKFKLLRHLHPVVQTVDKVSIYPVDNFCSFDQCDCSKVVHWTDMLYPGQHVSSLIWYGYKCIHCMIFVSS